MEGPVAPVQCARRWPAETLSTAAPELARRPRGSAVECKGHHRACLYSTPRQSSNGQSSQSVMQVVGASGSALRECGGTLLWRAQQPQRSSRITSSPSSVPRSRASVTLCRRRRRRCCSSGAGVCLRREGRHPPVGVCESVEGRRSWRHIVRSLAKGLFCDLGPQHHANPFS